jgi:hypothetical protein
LANNDERIQVIETTVIPMGMKEMTRQLAEREIGIKIVKEYTTSLED